jgi:hypothetical protein
MRRAVFFLSVLLASKAFASLELSYYFGDRRFSIKLTSEELRKLAKIQPLDESTVTLTPAKAGKLAWPEIERFQKKYGLPTPQLRRVGLSRLSESKEIWLWEVACVFEEKLKKGEGRTGQPARIFPFFVTSDGSVISPVEVPYSQRKK